MTLKQFYPATLKKWRVDTMGQILNPQFFRQDLPDKSIHNSRYEGSTSKRENDVFYVAQCRDLSLRIYCVHPVSFGTVLMSSFLHTCLDGSLSICWALNFLFYIRFLLSLYDSAFCCSSYIE